MGSRYRRVSSDVFAEETEFFKLACFKAGQIGPDVRRPASVASDTARGRGEPVLLSSQD